MSNGHIETNPYYTLVDYHGFISTVWWFGIISDGKIRFKLGNRRDKAVKLLAKLREERTDRCEGLINHCRNSLGLRVERGDGQYKGFFYIHYGAPDRRGFIRVKGVDGLDAFVRGYDLSRLRGNNNE